MRLGEEQKAGELVEKGPRLHAETQPTCRVKCDPRNFVADPSAAEPEIGPKRIGNSGGHLPSMTGSHDLH